MDDIKGTSGNDLIIAGEGSSGGVHTLGASDLIDGGDGVDTIDIKMVGHQLTPRMSNVEKVFAQALDTALVGTDSINLVNTTGVQELWSKNSTNDLAVTNLQEKATIGVTGGNASDYSVQAAAAALTDDLAIALDGANVGSLIVNATGVAGGAGYASTTINTATGTNAITGVAGTQTSAITALDVGNALATVNVTGDGAVRVTGNLAATVRTIDASANKGGVNLSIANNTGNVTFTGGEGADRIDFGTTLNLNDKVDGGAGRDILAVDSQVEIITGLQVSNVEILELNTLNGTLDASRIAGVDEVRVAATLANVSGTAVVNGLTSNSTFVTNDSGDVRLNITNAQVANTNDTLNLKTGIAAGGWIDVMAAGVENIVYTQNNAANALATTDLVFYDTDSVVDMSSLSVTNNAGNLVSARNLVNSIKTVNASAAKGSVALTIAGGNATNGVAITGGEGDDELFGGDGKDIIVGGAGDDHISGDGIFMIPGTGGAAIAQQTTVTIANEEAGDEFTVSIDGVDYTVTSTGAGTATGLLATAIGTASGAIASSTATSATVLTLNGLVDGTNFFVATNTQNAAAGPEVSTITIDDTLPYDAGDVVSVTISGIVYNYLVPGVPGATQTANQVAAGLAAVIQPAGQMAAAANANVITLTGADIATNYDLTTTPPVVTDVPAVLLVAEEWNLDLQTLGTAASDAITVTINGQAITVNNLTGTEATDALAITNAINAAGIADITAVRGPGGPGGGGNANEAVVITDATGADITISATQNGVTVGATLTEQDGTEATVVNVNVDPVEADNGPIAIGANTQTAVAAEVVLGQATDDQYFAFPANADILTGGAGDDTFWLLSGSNGWDGTSFATMDTITDLNLGGATAILGADQIVLDSAVFNAFANTDLINGGTALAMTGPNLGAAVQALFNAGGALNGSVNDIGLFTYSGDTYLIATDNVAGFTGNDVLIKVTGVSGTLDLTDIALA